ncbi:hypothetical protein KIN20_005622 [Parelaphostrongylus tenuis]|uniref:Uncharacterized protein n=1 Tax=Parelaphostrongylus tenuis TaxID=148309 RepID=A0AAD5MLR7_PARTN|nr:hypothetical protein KIN20_005622 [Parelaphostrongylus tenuis]
MEVLIPQGKELRYRCAVAGCRWPEKALSMCTMVEHLAYHYAKISGYAIDFYNILSFFCDSSPVQLGNMLLFFTFTSVWNLAESI